MRTKSNATCLRYFLSWGLVTDFTAILGINWCSVHDCTRSMQLRRCPTPREKPRAPCPTCCSNGVARKAWESTSEKLFFKNPAKHLAVSEIVRTFASLLRTTRALSSAGSERLPYKQRVGGSNPSAPTTPPEGLSFTTDPRFFYDHAAGDYTSILKVQFRECRGGLDAFCRPCFVLWPFNRTFAGRIQANV